MTSLSLDPPTQENDPLASAADLRMQRMLEMARDFDTPNTKPPPAPLETEPVAKPTTWLARFAKIPRRTLLLGVGIGLLVLFALLIGWVIGSANQPKTAAWQTSPQYEKMYLAMVADKYARTGDAAQVQRDLAGASPADVARILETLQRETTDTTQRQRLAALADTVRPPVTQTSYVPLLLNQPIFLLSLLFSLTPMFVAFGLVIGPYLRQQLRSLSSGEEKAAEGDSVALLGETVGAPIDPNAPVVGAPEAIEPTPEAGDAAPATPTEEEQKKKEEEEEEEEQQQEHDNGLGDLASLFEEEDTSLAALENFCKGLPEISVDVLIANAKETAKSLKEAIAHKG